MAKSDKVVDTRGLVRLGKPLDKIPSENDLRSILTSHCKYWRDIGQQLGLEPQVLNEVEDDHDKVWERYRVTLVKWLRLNNEGTWGDLEFAITNVNRISLGLNGLTKSDWKLAITPKSNLGPQQASSESQPVKHQIEQQESDKDDNDDDAAQPKAKQSFYPVISRRNQPCAIIVNNKTFKSKPEQELSERTWSEHDVDKIKKLFEKFGIHYKLKEDLEAYKMKDTLVSTVASQSTYSALIVFIMTHGKSGDMLYGIDGELVSLKELVECFEADRCPALKDKPKIFILHYCRGEDEEPAHREGGTSKKSASHDTPRKADFLIVHSSTDGYVTYGHEKTGFITKLVDAFTENLNENHLEDVLLIVKREVAKIQYKVDDQYYKQMPSVNSEMRDKVWFDED